MYFYNASEMQLVFFAHFLLVTNALAGSFLPPAYLFYNLLFFVALFWTLHCKESADAVYTVSYYILYIVVCMYV